MTRAEKREELERKVQKGNSEKSGLVGRLDRKEGMIRAHSRRPWGKEAGAEERLGESRWGVATGQRKSEPGESGQRSPPNEVEGLGLHPRSTAEGSRIHSKKAEARERDIFQ